MAEAQARRQLGLDARPMQGKWEAKWVPSAGRFVYINHANRTTTWDDPRPKSPPQYSHSSFAESLNSRKDPVAVMQEQFPAAPEEVIRECLRTSGGNQSVVASQLRSMGFSKKTPTMEMSVKDARLRLSSSSESSEASFHDFDQALREQEARRKAEQESRAAEEKRKADEARKRSAALAAVEQKRVRDAAAQKARADAAKKLAEQKRKAEAVKAARGKGKNTSAAAAKAPPAPTAAAKKAMEKRLAKAYPKLTTELITMVLTTVMYDETKAKVIMDEQVAQQAQQSGGAAASAAAAAAAALKPGQRKAFVPPPLPEFDTDEPAPPVRGYLGPQSSQMPSSGDFFAKLLDTSDSKKPDFKSTKGGASSAFSALTSSRPTKPAMSAPMDTAANPSEPYEAKGPDEDLASGANPNLRRGSGYARGRNKYLSNGHDGSLRHGRQVARIGQGCSLAMGKEDLALGSDPSNRCGPNRGPRVSLHARLIDVM